MTMIIIKEFRPSNSFTNDIEPDQQKTIVTRKRSKSMCQTQTHKVKLYLKEMTIKKNHFHFLSVSKLKGFKKVDTF